MLRSVYGIYILGLIAGAWLMNSIRDLEIGSNHGMLILILGVVFVVSNFLILKGRK